jgi:hypothetical protein
VDSRESEKDSTAKRKGGWIRFAPIGILIIVVMAVMLWSNWNDWFGSGGEDAAVVAAGTETGPGVTSSVALGEGTAAPSGGPAQKWPADLLAPRDCDQVIQDLKRWTAILDSRDYVKEWKLPDGVYGLLTVAAQDLAADRPVVTGELHRLNLLLANVSHLYLTLGRTRLEQIQILVQLEPDLVEPIALQLFRWLQVRQRCSSPDDRAPGFQAQYDYASFLLTTLGGQAYLRRRPARLEALGGFYALLILDQSISNQHNPYGLMLDGELQRYDQMLKGQNLVFVDRYRRLLEEIRLRHEKDYPG